MFGAFIKEQITSKIFFKADVRCVVHRPVL